MSIENTQEKIEQLNALRRQTRNWRVGAALASVAVTVVVLLVLRSTAVRLFEPGPTHDEFVSELKTGVQQEIVPQVKQLTVSTVTRLTPRVKTEVVKLQARAPEFAEALTSELELFQKNVPARAEKVLRASFNDVIQQREAKVRELYPDLTEKDVEAVLALLRKEGESRLANIAQQVTAPYQDVLIRITQDLNQIRDTEPVQVAGNTPAFELATLCASMLQDELQRTSPAEYQRFLTAALAEPQK